MRKKIVISKLSGSQPLFSKFSQSSEVPKVHNCVLSKEQRIRKQTSSQKAEFLDIYSHKIGQIRFLAQPRGHMTTQERLKDNSRHKLVEIFQVMRVVVNYRKGLKQLKKCHTSKEYPSRTTFLRPSIT